MGSPGTIPAERRRLRIRSITVLAVALGASAAVFAGPPQKPPIRGEGCVESGTEEHCLVLKDLRSGTQYTLFVKGIQPVIGSGIVFSGTPHHGMTTCMQGTAVDVVSWVHKDLKCTDGTAPKPKDQTGPGESHSTW